MSATPWPAQLHLTQSTFILYSHITKYITARQLLIQFALDAQSNHKSHKLVIQYKCKKGSDKSKEISDQDYSKIKALFSSDGSSGKTKSPSKPALKSTSKDKKAKKTIRAKKTIKKKVTKTKIC